MVNRLYIQKIILFMIGGISYYTIELLWRGYSHISMFILGGSCFVLIGSIREYDFRLNRSLLPMQCLSSLIITLLELGFGLILNVVLKLDIWDYSKMRFNFIGQISLRYSIYWFLLSLPAIILYDYLVYWLFEGERPRYRILQSK